MIEMITGAADLVCRGLPSNTSNMTPSLQPDRRFRFPWRRAGA